jgi:hypothetical protein
MGQRANALARAVVPAAALALGIIAHGCSGADEVGASSSGDVAGPGAGQGGGGTAQGGAGPGSGTGGDIFDPTSGAGGLSDDTACASQSAEAKLEKKPVDVVIVIDNSGSMGQEIVGVQNNINANFAQIIEASGVDYRVILLAKHGKADPDESVCIEAPLSGIPMGGCATPPAQPVNNPNKFFHYSFEVASHNSLCLVLTRFDQPDDFLLAPMGYQGWLRKEAFKIFVELTDDGVSCSGVSNILGSVSLTDGNSVAGGQTAADAFDGYLLALSPEHFGTEQNRNYRFYSIVALANKNPANPAEPWLPTDAVITAECPTAADPGTGYQALSNKTGGLKFPLCEPKYYDVVFNEIAKGVIAGASLGCEFPLPEPPPGQELDLASVAIEYAPGDGGPPESLKQAAGPSGCGPAAHFYIEGGLVKLCPDVCAQVQKDASGKIKILFDCVGANK